MANWYSLYETMYYYHFTLWFHNNYTIMFYWHNYCSKRCYDRYKIVRYFHRIWIFFSLPVFFLSPSSFISHYSIFLSRCLPSWKSASIIYLFLYRKMQAAAVAGSDPNKQREYLKKKKQRKLQRFKELEEERELEKNKWLAFTNKVCIMYPIVCLTKIFLETSFL